MWTKVEKQLKNHPERLRVARVLVQNGLSVRNGGIFCNDIEIPHARVARVAHVDRRTVNLTVRAIEGNTELNAIFKYLRSAGHSLKEVARYLGLGVVEITPVDARMPGILAKAASLIAQKGISIRQAIVDDPELAPEPNLTLVVENKLPGELVPKFLEIEGVSKVSIY